MESSHFLNVKILSVSSDKLLSILKEGILFTPNIDHLVKLQKDRDFYDAYRQAHWVICDSRVLYFMSKCLKDRIVSSIPGSTFFNAYCDYHKNDKDCRIFLLGALKLYKNPFGENIS